MTPKEKQLKDFIALYWEENGFAPSFEEMQLGIGSASKSEISRLVKGLVRCNQIEVTPYKNRSVRIKHDFTAYLKQRGLTQDYQQWSNT